MARWLVYHAAAFGHGVDPGKEEGHRTVQFLREAAELAERLGRGFPGTIPGHDHELRRLLAQLEALRRLVRLGTGVLGTAVPDQLSWRRHLAGGRASDRAGRQLLHATAA
jgi:hypothetical protein